MISTFFLFSLPKVYVGDLVGTISEDSEPLTVVTELSGYDEDGDELEFMLLSATYLVRNSGMSAPDQVALSIKFDPGNPAFFPFLVESTGPTTADLKLSNERYSYRKKISSKVI